MSERGPDDAIGGGVDDRDDARFRADIRAFLTQRLRAKHGGAPATVMGAGSDDIESGRSFLAVLAEGGLATPAWPGPR